MASKILCSFLVTGICLIIPEFNLFGNTSTLNKGNNNPFSEIAKGANAIPLAPDNLEVLENSFDYVLLVWQDNSTDEDYFIIERHTGGNDYAEYDTASANDEIYIDYQVQPATVYYYRIAAVNTSGQSEYSNEVITETEGLPDSKPRAPSELTGLYIAGTGNYMRWKDNSSNEDLFVIMRAEDNANFQTYDSVIYNQTNYTDENIASLSTYYYYVFAVNEYGTSDNTDTLKINVPDKDSVAPPVLFLYETSYNSITLGWDSVSEPAFTYKLSRTDAGGNSIEINNLLQNPFTDDNLISGNTYTYALTATSLDNYVLTSNEVSGKTLPWFTRDHISDDLVAMYSFSGVDTSFVSDIAWHEQPADIYLLEGEAFASPDQEFLDFNGLFKLTTLDVPDKIRNACQATNEVTLECWIKASEFSDEARPQTLFSLETADNLAFSMNSWPDPAKPDFFYYFVNVNTNSTGSSGKPDYVTLKSYPVNSLLHLVYTQHSSGDEVWFVNGEKENTGFRLPKYSKWPEVCQLSVGDNFRGNQSWHGSLYMLSVYNKALDSAQVLTNYLTSPFSKNNFVINPTDLKITLGPNPAQHVINLWLESEDENVEFAEVYHTRIIDQFGYEVYYRNLSGNLLDNTFTIDLDNFVNGIYTLVIYTDHQLIGTSKFSVVR